MKKIYLFFFLVGLTGITQAQSILGIEPTIKYGRAFRHTVNFRPDILHDSYAFDINLTWQTTGKKEWQRLRNYPWFGLNAGYTEFGNNAILGSAVYLVPNINLPLATGKKVVFYLRIGVGLAYLTKHYNVLTDTTNNVIASSINNCTSFSFRFRYKVNNHLHIFAGGSFTHFSTGDVKLPNLGINVPTGDIGINYTFKPADESAFNHDSVSPRNRHLIFGTKVGIGFHQVFVANGPEFPLYIAQVNVGKYVGRWNKFSLGTQVDFDQGNYYFLINQEIDDGKQRNNSTDLGLFFQDEMQFGNFAIPLQMAYNLKQAVLSGGRLYEKLGVEYYFLHFGKEKWMGLSLGIYLTTHFFEADYVSSEIGVVF